jgi:hypothetical protein
MEAPDGKSCKLLLRPKEVLVAHAAALFFKDGFDKDGLLPYEVWNNWRDSVNNWPDSVNNWPDSVNNWPDSVNNWHDSVNNCMIRWRLMNML